MKGRHRRASRLPRGQHPVQVPVQPPGPDSDWADGATQSGFPWSSPARSFSAHASHRAPPFLATDLSRPRSCLRLRRQPAPNATARPAFSVRACTWPSVAGRSPNVFSRFPILENLASTEGMLHIVVSATRLLELTLAADNATSGAAHVETMCAQLAQDVVLAHLWTLRQQGQTQCAP